MFLNYFCNNMFELANILFHISALCITLFVDMLLIEYTKKLINK